MDLKKLRPTADRVIVEVEKTADVSEGGIVIPDMAKEPLTRGVVLAVGRGKVVNGKFVETTVKAGERVIFGKYAGSDVQGTDVKGVYRILSEEDLLAVIEE